VLRGGSIGCNPPGRHDGEALVSFACLLEEARVPVIAGATAIDLVRMQLDKADRLRRHSTLYRRLPQGLQGVQVFVLKARMCFWMGGSGSHGILPTFCATRVQQAERMVKES
jgi:hypothetical protein